MRGVDGRGAVGVDEAVHVAVAGVHEAVDDLASLRGEDVGLALGLEDEDQGRHAIIGLLDHVGVGEDASGLDQVDRRQLEGDRIVGGALGIPPEDGPARVTLDGSGGVGAGVALVVRLTLLGDVSALDLGLPLGGALDQADACGFELGRVARVHAELEQEPHVGERGLFGGHLCLLL